MTRRRALRVGWSAERLTTRHFLAETALECGSLLPLRSAELAPRRPDVATPSNGPGPRSKLRSVERQQAAALQRGPVFLQARIQNGSGHQAVRRRAIPGPP